MKIILSFLFCLLCLSGLTAQVSTFNQTYDLGFSSIIFERAVVTDSFIYVSGIGADSLPPYRSGALFAKLDLEGNPILINHQLDQNREYYGGDNLTLVQEDQFVRIGIFYDYLDENDPYKAFLILYDSEGDTMFSRAYLSPYHYLFWVRDILQTPDHGFLILGFVKVQFGDDLQAYLLKTDSLGIKEWDMIYGDPGINEYVSQILPRPDNEYLILVLRSNFNIFSNGFTSRIVLLKLDNENILSEYWESNGDSLLAAGHLIITEDQGYLFTGSLGKEFPINANTGTIKDKGYILQLDQNFEKQWEIIFQDSTYDNYTGLTKSILLADGSGYMACGTVHEVTFEPEYQSNVNGWLVKYTASGDSLWSRYFHYWDTPYDVHYFYDMEQMPDGGILLCGQAYSGNGGPQQQLGWLVKLDEQGCLVPGCDLVATEDMGDLQEAALLLYPNPVSEVLNVYTWLPEIPRRAILRIVGSDGVVVRESAITQRDLTTMIPVRDLPAGVYYAQLEADGILLDVEEVVVAH